MPSPEMLRRVVLVRTDVSEERSASNIRVTKIGELGTKLEVSTNRSALRRNTINTTLHYTILYYTILYYTILYYTIVHPYYVVFLRSVLSLLVTANAVPSSPILFTLIIEAVSSSEASVLTRAT
jgi:hypothetical protein